VNLERCIWKDATPLLPHPAARTACSRAACINSGWRGDIVARNGDIMAAGERGWNGRLRAGGSSLQHLFCLLAMASGILRRYANISALRLLAYHSTANSSTTARASAADAIAVAALLAAACRAAWRRSAARWDAQAGRRTEGYRRRIYR